MSDCFRGGNRYPEDILGDVSKGAFPFVGRFRVNGVRVLCVSTFGFIIYALLLMRLNDHDAISPAYAGLSLL